MWLHKTILNQEKRRTRTGSRRFNGKDRILDMHAGMIRHRVDGGQQASASAIRTMALGRADNSSWVTPIRWIPGFKLCEVQKWGALAKPARRQGDPGCLWIKWEGKEWLTEGILIATELAGFAHPGGDVPPKHRLHRSTIPFPPLQTKCRDGTMLQEY